MVSSLRFGVPIKNFKSTPDAYWWWNPRKESTTADFCLDSSLHGLKYISQPDRHLSERIFWAIIVLSSVMTSAYFISTVFSKYYKNPVIVAFKPQETSIQNIPFPAITVCNINNIQKSVAKQYFRDAEGPASLTATKRAQRNLYYLEHICNYVPSFSRIFNYSLFKTKVDPDLLRTVNLSLAEESRGDIAKFFGEASQNCSDLVRLCVWRGETIPCEEIFHGIETDNGFCCVFNMVPQSLLHVYRNDSRDSEESIRRWAQWNVKEDGLFLSKERKIHIGVPKRQKRSGKSSGLSILLDPDENEYFCTNTDSVGFQVSHFDDFKEMVVAAHLPIDVPHIVDKGVAIKPNSEVFVNIQPEITMANSNILGFSQEKRHCYDKNEYSLHFYNYYSSSNCVDECLANHTYRLCNCVSYYMPRDDNRGLCSNHQYECTENVLRSFYNKGAGAFCSQCMPSCDEIRYHTETTFIPILDQSIWEDEKGNKPNWAHKNVSIVHIFFGSGRTYARVRSELYGVIDLIASTGGLLGLCLGFSGISVIELIYFFTMRVYCARRKRKNEEAKIIENSRFKRNTWANHIVGGEILTDSNSYYTKNQKLGHISFDVNSFLR